MPGLEHLIDNNRRWARNMESRHPGIFTELADQQHPEYLWIGCADSRIPANDVIGLEPGRVFVHRNVANIVNPDDLNCQSVIQFAVEALRIKHIIVCGHYNCGGVRAAASPDSAGLLDYWLQHLRELYGKHQSELDALPEPDRLHLLSELNVVAQVGNVCNSDFVQQAWNDGQPLMIHGWIYDVSNGLIKDLDITCDSPSHQNH